MITLTIIILLLALLLIAVSGVSVLLLDPIIAVLAIILLYKLIKKLCFKS